uniref:Putative ribonuclease H-like domain-containing protein n=1 Tax=Tanacetum cinerariifolium TaxID=118510 RepID=A0A6L2LDP2_TANCI|nr:putative ribonuclease H-like domain-containing protein [Tanacetum cinerariifolium]
MISMRIKKFHKGTGILLETAELNEIKTVEEEMVEAIDWSGHVEEDTQNFAMMAYSSSNLGSDSESVFMNKECDLKNTLVNDRYAEGMHTVPLPMTGNYMPSGPDVEIDYSKFKPSTSVPEPVVNESKVVSEPKAVREPKVWTNAPITEEYESYSDDDLVSNVQENIEKPSFAFTGFVKHVKSPRENVKETSTPNHYPKIEKQDRHSHTRKGLDYARKSCFVCDSFSHLIRDCDFHEKRMAKQAALTKSKEKGTGQQAHRPVWNNVQRVNHQNKFISSAVLTKTGKIPVNVARQNFSRQATLTSTTSKVNTARPFVNETRPTSCFYKSHSPHKRPFHNKTAQRNTFPNHKVNTVNTSLSVVKGNEDTDVKASAGNKAHLADYQEFKGGSVAFGELKHYNLLFVSQMCDKKNKVLFTDTDCLVLSPDFKLPDENQVLLKIPTQHNMYSFNLKNIDPSGGLSCLFAKALIDESNTWHRRLGHVNFKNLNKLLKGNLVRGLPSKIFENNHTCVACQKGKQHKASCPQEANNSAGTQANDDQGTNSEESNLHDEHFVLPIWSAYSTTVKSSEEKIQKTPDYKTSEKPDVNTYSTNLLNVVSAPISVVSPSRALNDDEPSYPDDPLMPHLEDIYAPGIFTDSSYDNKGVSAFLYDTIDEEVYVTQPPGFVDPKFPNKVKHKEDGIFISQDKYVAEILKKFDFLNVKTASTPIETQKPLVKDEEATDVDVTPKTSHIQAMKRIFRYLKGQPKLGLWYPKVSSFNVEATQTVIMLVQFLTGNPQQEVVNFLVGDLFHGNAKSRLLWLLLLRRQNMLLLLTTVDKFCGFRINYKTMGST